MKFKKDIFVEGFSNPIWWILGGLILIGIFAPPLVEQIADIAFFFLLGGLCIWNYRRCGRVHCQITGYGFSGVGVIALLNLLNVITLSEGTIWLIFLVVLIVGYGLEFAYKKKTGTCYKK